MTRSQRQAAVHVDEDQELAPAVGAVDPRDLVMRRTKLRLFGCHGQWIGLQSLLDSIEQPASVVIIRKIQRQLLSSIDELVDAQFLHSLGVCNRRVCRFPRIALGRRQTVVTVQSFAKVRAIL